MIIRRWSEILVPLLVALTVTQTGFAQQPIQKAPGLQAVDHWFTLAPNIDEFSIEMPGLSTFVAPTQPNTYMFKHGRSVYMLISFPRFEKNSSEEPLNATGDLFSKKLIEYFHTKGVNLDRPVASSLNLNGTPGLEYSLSDGEELYVQRLYRTKTKLYSLAVIVPVSETSSAQRFLGSFSFDRKAPLQFIEVPSHRRNVPMGAPIAKPAIEALGADSPVRAH